LQKHFISATHKQLFVAYFLELNLIIKFLLKLLTKGRYKNYTRFVKTKLSF